MVLRLKSPSDSQPDLFFWSQAPRDSAGASISQLEAVLAAAPVQESSAPRIGASALAAALSHLQQRQPAPLPGPPLASVLQPERLLPLLARHPALTEAMAPHLPEPHRSTECIAHLVSTPQFRHTLQMLDHALNSGQINAAHFGVQAEVHAWLVLTMWVGLGRTCLPLADNEGSFYGVTHQTSPSMSYDL